MPRIFSNLLFRVILLFYCCATVQAFDTASFLGMSKDQQTFYLLGLVDSELLKSSDNGYCILTWARDDMHMFLSDWYAASEKHTGETSIALIVSQEINRTCNDSSS